MTAALVLMTLLVGIFIGSTATLATALFLENKTKTKRIHERAVIEYSKKHGVSYSDAEAIIFPSPI